MQFGWVKEHMGLSTDVLRRRLSLFFTHLWTWGYWEQCYSIFGSSAVYIYNYIILDCTYVYCFRCCSMKVILIAPQLAIIRWPRKSQFKSISICGATKTFHNLDTWSPLSICNTGCYRIIVFIYPIETPVECTTMSCYLEIRMNDWSAMNGYCYNSTLIHEGQF